ncbi:unnamed protein product [Phytomonas sp. Hart1]|nr:unnamed protein product [Phytomonas sp. Hart1]|eukprot:CCW69475.1 unnamed protein product [Phytomonas sp. isolate Hart1]
MAHELRMQARNRFSNSCPGIPFGAPSGAPREARKPAPLEISYSSTLLLGWVLLLAYISWGCGYVFPGFTIILLSSLALTSEHGESRMLMPLVFLSERCLEHQMKIEHSFLHFYASALLSYFSLAACSGLVRVNSSSYSHLVFKILLFTLVGVAAVYFIVQDKVFSLGVVAYVAAGHVFFLRLRPHLGENEAVLVSSITGFYICDTCVNNNLSADGGRSLISDLNAPGYLTSYTHVAGRGMILSAIYTIVCMKLFSQLWRVPVSRYSKSSEWRISRRCITTIFWISCTLVGVVVCAAISYQFQENALFWLYAYIVSSPFRLFMILGWVTGIPLALVFVELFTSGLRKAARRKMFHFIAVIAFTPASLIDPPFMVLATSTAISLLVTIEVARCHNVYGTEVITRFISDYIDERDDIKGIVRTHIYLLFGFCVSQVIYYRHHHQATAMPIPAIMELSINIIPGILSLGIVDASAAIIGSSVMLGSRRVLGRYLKNKFFTERANVSIVHKTTTGTIGGLLCGIIFWCIILALEDIPLSGPMWYTFTMIVVCSLTECFINTVDNLQMPLVVLCAVYNLFAILLPISGLWKNPSVSHSNPTRATSLASALSFPWKNGFTS